MRSRSGSRVAERDARFMRCVLHRAPGGERGGELDLSGREIKQAHQNRGLGHQRRRSHGGSGDQQIATRKYLVGRAAKRQDVDHDDVVNGRCPDRNGAHNGIALKSGGGEHVLKQVIGLGVVNQRAGERSAFAARSVVRIVASSAAQNVSCGGDRADADGRCRGAAPRWHGAHFSFGG